jgi:imidazolonepropionase
MSLLITNIKQLIGIQENNISVLKGKEMQQLHTIEDAFLLVENGNIKDYGQMSQLHSQSSVFSLQSSNIRHQISAEGRVVGPSWCDSHTHIVYAGSRENEFVDRIKGLSYEEIAKRGGGILNSAKKLHDASEDELFESAWVRLEEIKKMGTGAVEIKSGYGLSVEGELKMLRVIKKLKEKSSLTIKSTFLGAHAYPLEYKQDHDGYIKLMIEKMLPVIAEEKLADYIDAFCEFGFFSVDETSRVLEAGIKYGLKPKIHANQLNYSGGIQVGVKYNAISVDHLECVGEDELNSLMNSHTIGTLLPSAAFFLGLHYQPARKMIDSGLPIALATDYNPGSSPSGNMNFVLSLACTQLKMLPEEAINACTLNGACAMEVNNELGSITKGKKANLFITKPISSYAYIPYSFGNHQIETVILNGNIE